MAKIKTKKWHRDLTEFEKRVDFVKLNESWDTAEEVYIDEVTPIVTQIKDKLFKDISKILESKDYNKLTDIKIGYHDKLVNIIKQRLFEAYRVGKEQAYKEMKKDKEVQLSTGDRQYFTIKAEAIVDNLFSQIKTQSIFIVLSGLKAQKNDREIMADLKGIDYGEGR